MDQSIKLDIPGSDDEYCLTMLEERYGKAIHKIFLHG
jgi:hypothetical protein